MKMKQHGILCSFIILICTISIIDALKCGRKLDGITTSPLPLEGRFWLTLSSYNRTEIVDQYMPNTKYNVTIESKKTSAEGPQQFVRFLLTLENKNDSLSAGSFDLADELLTQFSDKCPSAVVESNQIPKADISVFWTSPPEGSGCVIIRGIIVENAETWFTSEGGLEKIVCQDPKAIEDEPGPVLPECCACDEAKYEVTFEGLWSRNTHPKDFPSKGWEIRFSDVIGASHTVDYSFWQNEELASAGLQQVAEYGTTRKLESELKGKSDKIRTIIKARGISYPNVTGRTFAVFRVDNKHHLMSLVSMIVPSPDWIVGVSGLELCLSNCSWIEHKELNLYPFDAGTDNGITYTSADEPTDPPEPIKRITPFYPNDTRAPFYDPSGADMKPLAKLYLNRQRLYEKTCDEIPEPESNSGGDDTVSKRPRNKACKTTQWGPWGPCPTTCGGKQLRQRSYRDPAAALANNCTAALTDRRSCHNDDPHCVEEGILSTPECELNEWGAWSKCTASCGESYQHRSRNFRHKKHRKLCRAEPNGPELQQTIACQNGPCPDPQFEEKCPADQYHNWSNWAPCTSTCGEGVTIRSRQPVDEAYKGPDECKTQVSNCTAEIISCDISQQEASEICSEPIVVGDCKGRYKRVYFDPEAKQCHIFDYSGCGGNRNNFLTIEECNNVCVNYERAEADTDFNGLESGSQVSTIGSAHDNDKKVDCRFTEWSGWSRCNGCRGYTFMSRRILVPARNGGSACPRKLLRKKRCRKVIADCSANDRTRRKRHRN